MCEDNFAKCGYLNEAICTETGVWKMEDLDNPPCINSNCEPRQTCAPSLLYKKLIPLAPEACNAAAIFPTGTISWTRSNLNKDALCHCLGAAQLMDFNLHDEDCTIDRMSLAHWGTKCNSIELCGPQAIEALSQHGQCQALGALLEETNAAVVDSSVICPCVQTIHNVPECSVSGLSLVEHQIECEEYHEYDPSIAYETYPMCTMQEINMFLASSTKSKCKTLSRSWQQGKNWNEQDCNLIFLLFF